jgi:hypothetical protein
MNGVGKPRMITYVSCILSLLMLSPLCKHSEETSIKNVERSMRASPNSDGSDPAGRARRLRVAVLSSAVRYMRYYKKSQVRNIKHLMLEDLITNH